MKVKDLIIALSELDPEAIAVLSSDGEGNSYSPVSDFNWGVLYEAESTWSGVVHNPEEWAEENDFDEEDLQDPENACPGVPCVVIYPVN